MQVAGLLCGHEYVMSGTDWCGGPNKPKFWGNYSIPLFWGALIKRSFGAYRIFCGFENYEAARAMNCC